MNRQLIETAQMIAVDSIRAEPGFPAVDYVLLNGDLVLAIDRQAIGLYRGTPGHSPILTVAVGRLLGYYDRRQDRTPKERLTGRRRPVAMEGWTQVCSRKVDPATYSDILQLTDGRVLVISPRWVTIYATAEDQRHGAAPLAILDLHRLPEG